MYGIMSQPYQGWLVWRRVFSYGLETPKFFWVVCLVRMTIALVQKELQQFFDPWLSRFFYQTTIFTCHFGGSFGKGNGSFSIKECCFCVIYLFLLWWCWNFNLFRGCWCGNFRLFSWVLWCAVLAGIAAVFACFSVTIFSLCFWAWNLRICVSDSILHGANFSGLIWFL